MALALWASAAPGADRDLGSFKAWRAHTFDEGKSLVCSMWSQPVKSVGKYTRRGEVFAFVTHRPAEKRLQRVSFEIGYTFDTSKPFELVIDGKRTFRLRTSGSTAWVEDAAENEKLVQHMRAGGSMVVKAVSNRGTETTDTFSLSGFTAGYRAISKACKK